MPHVDGFTLAEEIRDIDPDVPLFFLSAKTLKEDIITGYKLGADDYITKPFDSEVLLLKIKAIIKRNEDDNKVTECLRKRSIIQNQRNASISDIWKILDKRIYSYKWRLLMHILLFFDMGLS